MNGVMENKDMSDTSETDSNVYNTGMYDPVAKCFSPKSQQVVLADVARKLERERNEARDRLLEFTRFCDISAASLREAITERDQLRKEVEELETRHAATMLHTQSVVDENNQLRKVADELAMCLHNPAIFQRMESIEALANYNSLPHVLAKEKK